MMMMMTPIDENEILMECKLISQCEMRIIVTCVVPNRYIIILIWHNHKYKRNHEIFKIIPFK